MDVNDDVVLELVVQIWIPHDALAPTLNSVISSMEVCERGKYLNWYRPICLYIFSIWIKLVSTWSGDSCWLRRASNRAWSGCRRALDGRRGLLFDGVGEPPFGGVTGCTTDGTTTPGKHTNAFGDGDAWIDSMPESAACDDNGSMNNELRRGSPTKLSPPSSDANGNMKLWPSASPRGESYIS